MSHANDAFAPWFSKIHQSLQVKHRRWGTVFFDCNFELVLDMTIWQSYTVTKHALRSGVVFKGRKFPGVVHTLLTTGFDWNQNRTCSSMWKFNSHLPFPVCITDPFIQHITNGNFKENAPHCAYMSHKTFYSPTEIEQSEGCHDWWLTNFSR